MEPGDILLVHSGGIFAKIIRLGQRLRFRGVNAKYAGFNHAAVALSADTIIEARIRGVVINKLPPYEICSVHPDLTPEELTRFLSFLRSRVGDEYGGFEIDMVMFSLITGHNLPFRDRDSDICSGLVAEGLWLANPKKFPFHDPWDCTPAELAQYFGVPYEGGIRDLPPSN